MKSTDAELREIRVDGRNLKVSAVRTAPASYRPALHPIPGLPTRVFDSMTEGISITDTAGTILYTNPAEDRLLGYERGELVGQRGWETGAAAAEQLTMEGSWTGEGRCIRKDGVPVQAAVRVTTVEAGQKQYFVCTHDNIGRECETTDASPAPEALMDILQVSLGIIGADAYAVWREHNHGGGWTLTASEGLSDASRRAGPGPETGSGQSLPSGLIAIEDVETSFIGQHGAWLRAERICSLLSIPLNIDGESAGMIVFYYRSPHRFTEAELRVGAGLGSLAATVYGIRDSSQRQLQLLLEAERAQHRSSLLAEAATLLSSSLDYSLTLSRVAEIVVPAFADYCAVDVMEEGGELRPVGFAHRDPAMVEFARESHRKYPPQTRGAIYNAVQKGQPVLVEKFSDASMAESARNAEYLSNIRALSIESYIMVPLLTCGRMLGILTFAIAGSGRRYTPADLRFAEELASRAATAIDNARLHAGVLESEERLRMAQAAAGIGTWDWDLTTHTIRWSPEIYRILGVAEEDVRPSPAIWLQHIHPEDRGRLAEEARRAIYGCTPLETEFRLLRPSGEVRWILCRAKVFQDEAGKPMRVVGLHVDETPQKLAERRTAFLLNLDDSLQTLSDPDEIMQTTARMIVEHLGVIRWMYAEVEPGQYTCTYASDYNRGVLRAIKGGTLEHFEKQLARLCRDGETFFTEEAEGDPQSSKGCHAAMWVPLHKAGRFVAGISVQQTTSRRWQPDEIELVQQAASRCWESIARARIAKQLRDSEARFRQLANAVPAFVWVTSHEAQATYLNEHWYTYTGLSPEKSIGRGWVDTVHPDDVERVFAAWEDAIKRRGPFTAEIRYRGADGNYRWFMSRALPVHDATGKIPEWFGTSTDINDAKRVEEALRMANANLEQFAYAASHDLKEPLRRITAFSQLLQRRYQNKLDHAADQYLTYLSDGAKRMEMLINDLLRYTREGDTTDEKIAPANTEKVLAEAVSNLQSAIRESNAVIEIGALPEVLPVKDVHLLQLFQNLIGNAIKYRGELPPVITVAAEQKATQWTLSVRDNGIGIALEDAAQIFGVFVRLHTWDRYPGTGIGLAICQKIVQRYGGRIWVESEGAGKGSTFFFTLPGHSM